MRRLILIALPLTFVAVAGLHRINQPQRAATEFYRRSGHVGVLETKLMMDGFTIRRENLFCGAARTSLLDYGVEGPVPVIVHFRTRARGVWRDPMLIVPPLPPAVEARLMANPEILDQPVRGRGTVLLEGVPLRHVYARAAPVCADEARRRRAPKMAAMFEDRG